MALVIFHQRLRARQAVKPAAKVLHAMAIVRLPKCLAACLGNNAQPSWPFSRRGGLRDKAANPLRSPTL